MTENDHTGNRSPVRVLIFSGSRRENSLNTKLARLARDEVEATGATVDYALIQEFDCPSYDGDIEDADGLPEGAHELKRRLEASDALIVASPEYNASMPGILKNIIDWTSRHRPQPFNQHHCLLMS